MYAAYRAATEHKGQPTVILAHTIKGYTLGTHFEGRNATHQMKKLTLQDLKDFRDTQRIPISDAELKVVNTPEVLSFATAECAFTLMLMAARRAGEGADAVLAGGRAGRRPSSWA